MPVIEVDTVSKKYNLGTISQRSFLEDIKLRFCPRKVISKSDTENLFWALKDVSFSIDQGKVTGIVGKNGAGKSTLLKILSNIVAPTTGTIKINGRISSLLEVGTGFHPELTGRENIFLNGAILGMSRSEIRLKLDSIIEFSGVKDFIDTPVKRYSSGMYVRLAFAVAAFLEPDILILDEVLAVGDSEFQKKCIDKMNNVAKNGQTVLFVSHSIPSIQSLCQDCLYLEKGGLKMSGPTEMVLSQYMSDSAHQTILRSGNLQARCLEIKILNASNEASNFFLPNETIKFQLTIESDVMMTNISIAVGIDSSLDQRVTSFWSEFKGERFHLDKGINRFEIHLSSNKLIPSTYNLLTYIGKEGIVIEEVKNIATLTIGIDPDNNCVVPVTAHGLYVDEFTTRKLD
jgi:lipopolysaccharide transport system ATP-binding protein